jgi:glycosyltransferase involved in cell wall biosynthesis
VADVYHITGDIHYVACLLPPKRTVLTILDCQILDRLSGWRRAVVRYFWYTLPAKRAAQITVISSETKTRLLEYIDYPAERIHVIPVSVSELYQPHPKAFHCECPRILQIGTKANKNVPRLVQALRGLNCHLDIVGPVDDTLKSLLQECGVQWTGWGRLSDEELLQRYHEADIVAFVSTSEGFGMPIVEAQRVERVCITSNCSSMPEVAGDGACLVDPRDVDAIRAGFDRILASVAYRDQLLEHGRANCRRFDAAEISEQFAKIYESLL